MENLSHEIRDARESDADGAGPKKAECVAFIKIPNDYAGKLLGKGKLGAHALRLLAIKLHHGGEAFTLNAEFCARHYRVAPRDFKAGLRLMQYSGVVVRHSRGGRNASGRRRFAAEKLAQPRTAGYVAIPLTDLKCRATELAFRVAVLLSPRPISAVDAGARAGITSRATVNRNIKRLQGEITVTEVPGKPTLLSRHGLIFDNHDRGIVNSEPVNSEPFKNEPVQTRWKTPDKLKDIHLSDRMRPPHGDAADCDFEFLGPWFTLAVSRLTREVQYPDTAAVSHAESNQFLTPSQWRSWLSRFGGAPEHVAGSTGHLHANQIAHALLALAPKSALCGAEVAIGLAWAVARAVRDGAKIRSLGFIVCRLANAIEVGDLSFARDWPPGEDCIANAGFAELMLAELRAAGVPVYAPRLLASFERCRLSDLARRFGFDAVERAMSGPVPSRLAAELADGRRQLISWVAYETAAQREALAIRKKSRKHHAR